MFFLCEINDYARGLNTVRTWIRMHRAGCSKIVPKVQTGNKNGLQKQVIAVLKTFQQQGRNFYICAS